jgi:hypothetical protein
MTSLAAPTKRLVARVTFAGLVLVFASGCSFFGKRINAYERAVLSKPGMALVENGKEQAAMNHMFNAREGSTGGLGGAGGGCGCN